MLINSKTAVKLNTVDDLASFRANYGSQIAVPVWISGVVNTTIISTNQQGVGIAFAPTSDYVDLFFESAGGSYLYYVRWSKSAEAVISRSRVALTSF